ncbi:MAG: DUF1461 domain-containing protein [Candidatus Limnocylindrales bacterium]
MQSLRGTLAALVVGVITAIVIVALSILPFFNPVYIAFGQARAQSTAWTGWTTEQLRTVTDAILADLIIGPPDFHVTLDGVPVLGDRERGHMVDVRTVFEKFYLVAIGAGFVLAGAFAFSTGRDARARLWRGLARSGGVIAVVTLVGGALGVLFFDAAFEVFHSLFFPAGSYDFDTGTERLVQIFPQQFWVEVTVGVGVVIVALSVLLALVGGRRAARLEDRFA